MVSRCPAQSKQHSFSRCGLGAWKTSHFHSVKKEKGNLLLHQHWQGNILGMGWVWFWPDSLAQAGMTDHLGWQVGLLGLILLCVTGWLTVWRLRVRRRSIQLKLNQVIQEQHTILQALMEVPIIRLDERLNIVWSNQAMCATKNCDLSSLIGQPCYRVLQQQESPCLGCTAVETLRTGEYQSGQVTLADGRTLELRSTPLHDEKGRIIRIWINLCA